jgi:hypothetical protein
MKGPVPGGVVEPLQTLFAAGTAGSLTDGQLLERFAGRREHDAEAAFAALVSRHGPMVRRVCRSLLADTNDADDVKEAIAQGEITWRCWWDGDKPDAVGPIATTWNIHGYPAFILIDGRGVTRSKKDTHPFDPSFDDCLEMLLKEAESAQPRR